MLLSDTGSEFNNQVLAAICKEYGINKTNVMAYKPSSNGMVERQNRKIISTLRMLVRDTSNTWHEWTPQVIASLNSSLHKSIGDTPHFIVYGQDFRLPYTFLLKEEDPIYNFDDYVRLRGTDFQRIYKRVTDNIAISKETMNEYQWSIAADKQIALGDIVFTKIQEPKNKLAARFEGPYRVIAYDKGDKVKIRHMTTLETKLAHLDHLKRTKRPSSSVEEDTESVSSTQPDPPTTEGTVNADVDEFRKKLRSYKNT